MKAICAIHHTEFDTDDLCGKCVHDYAYPSRGKTDIAGQERELLLKIAENADTYITARKFYDNGEWRVGRYGLALFSAKLEAEENMLEKFATLNTYCNWWKSMCSAQPAVAGDAKTARA